MRIRHPAAGRMGAVLHLEPVVAFAAAIRAAAVFRDDAFEAHAAGGKEQVVGDLVTKTQEIM